MMYRVNGEIAWSLLLFLISVVSGCFSLVLISGEDSEILEFCLHSSVGSISYVLYVDWVSALFFSFVSLISSSVVFYSGSYMGGDLNKELFLKLVMAFVLSMFLLVFSLNMISILLGWDGLGIVSYALVIYYQNDKSNSAGMITALSNRIGDVAILLSIGSLVESGSWNFMFSPVSGFGFSNSLAFLVMVAAMTKSAQMPFSAWLPAAMAAPTPVSALVHSSTLVTAGVYLLIRFNPLLIEEGWGYYLVLVGWLTTFMASVSANFETDLKKVVALSTLSQLGIMMSTLAMGFPKLAFFHLIAHAVFKALLFMCSGKIIHESGETQDSRSMGGLLRSMPWTSVCLNLSNLALCGFPFLAGFYSKDLLVELGLMEDLSGLGIVFLAVNVGLSASYSVRLSWSSLMKESSRLPLSGSGESDLFMVGSKTGLAFFAVVSGSGLAWLIFPVLPLVVLSTGWKVMALAAVGVGGLVGFLLSVSESVKSKCMKGSLMFVFMCQMWFLPLTTGEWVGLAGTKSSGVVKLWDLGWGEYVGGQGVYLILLKGASGLSVWQNSMVKLFLMIFVGAVVFCAMMFLGSF
uniref:NADH-ubiquinone oxidoreductase chain 5 n=1 Tax=Sphaeroma serratum TaxID=96875 RepID=E3SXB4_SPHSR|nr:NADH dehydrogenase subunit 5 [Sphaeroma serratum]